MRFIKISLKKVRALNGPEARCRLVNHSDTFTVLAVVTILEPLTIDIGNLPCAARLLNLMLVEQKPCRFAIIIKFIKCYLIIEGYEILC